MGALEDAIAAGDVDKQVELSSLFRDARNNALSLSDLVRGSGGGVYIADPAKRQAYYTLAARADSEARRERQGLADLVALSKGIQGLDPQAQADILGGRRIVRPGTPPASVQKAMLDRQRALEVAAIRSQSSGANRRTPAPPELIDSIGQPGFTGKVAAFRQGANLDPQTTQMLLEQDRKERDFARKGSQTKTAPLNPYRKLLQLAGTGTQINRGMLAEVFSRGASKQMSPEEAAQPISFQEIQQLRRYAEQAEGARGAAPVAIDQGGIQTSPQVDERTLGLRNRLFGE